MWQQEIVGLLTQRQIKCHLSKSELYEAVSLQLCEIGKYICEEAAKNGESELK